jgi:hypothetical protein
VFWEQEEIFLPSEVGLQVGISQLVIYQQPMQNTSPQNIEYQHLTPPPKKQAHQIK